MPFPRFPDPGPPPVPVSASWDEGASEIAVVFDRPLAEGWLDARNWSYGPVTAGAEIEDAVAVAERVVLVLGGEVPFVESVSYSPPPFDVVSAQGAPAQAFSDFPVD